MQGRRREWEINRTAKRSNWYEKDIWLQGRRCNRSSNTIAKPHNTQWLIQHNAHRIKQMDIMHIYAPKGVILFIWSLSDAKKKCSNCNGIIIASSHPYSICTQSTLFAVVNILKARRRETTHTLHGCSWRIFLCLRCWVFCSCMTYTGYYWKMWVRGDGKARGYAKR